MEVEGGKRTPQTMDEGGSGQRVEYEDEQEVVRMCNELLSMLVGGSKIDDPGAARERVHGARDVINVSTNTPMYAAVCEMLVGSKIDSLRRHGPDGAAQKANVGDKIHNVQVVVKLMSERLFMIDLSHIDARRAVHGVWEDNKNIIELLYFYAQRRSTASSCPVGVTNGSLVKADASDTSTEKPGLVRRSPKEPSSKRDTFSTRRHPEAKSGEHKQRIWRPSTAGKSSRSFDSYGASETKKKAPTAETRKGDEPQDPIATQSLTKEACVPTTRSSRSKTAEAAERTRGSEVGNRLIRLSPYGAKKKKRSKETPEKKHEQDDVSLLAEAGIHEPYLASPNVGQGARDRLGTAVDTSFASVAMESASADGVGNHFRNDEAVASVISLLENTLNSMHGSRWESSINDTLTNYDVSTVQDAGTYLRGLTNNANVVAKLVHLIKLFREESCSARTTDKSLVPARYTNELQRLYSVLSLRKQMWIKDRVVDGRVRGIQKQKQQKIAERNQRHQRKVEEIVKKKFLEDVDALKRSQEMRHRSIERTAWQAAFLEALDMQKEELISNRRNRSSLDHDGAKAPYRARAITLSEKTKAAKEEIARVEEEDRLHSQMFQSLQMNAVKTAFKKSKQATVDASDSRMKLGETKAKLQLQRLNYIEQIENDVSAAYTMQRLAGHDKDLGDTLKALLEKSCRGLEASNK